MPRDMQSCSQSTVCPKCKHQFACCDRRSFSLTGGGIVGQQAPILPNPCLSPQTPEVSIPHQKWFNGIFQKLFFCSYLGFTEPITGVRFPPQTASAASAPHHQSRGRAATLTRYRSGSSPIRLVLRGHHFWGVSRYVKRHQSMFTVQFPSCQPTNFCYQQIGTFLVRTSSNPKFLFSLSVQTERGPTSVRLHYVNGYFRLEAQPHLYNAMPAFPNVIDLIQYYVDEFKRYRKGKFAFDKLIVATVLPIQLKTLHLGAKYKDWTKQVFQNGGLEGLFDYKFMPWIFSVYNGNTVVALLFFLTTKISSDISLQNI